MLYLLRHGETIWNREGRIQGQRDSPLTRTGITQTEHMGTALRREIGDPRTWAIVSSPLGRAWQSATIMAEVMGLDPLGVALEPRLMEMSFGHWEGLKYEEIEAREPGILARRERDLWNFRPPGGESYADLSARVAAWVSTLEDWASLIVVCHGGTGRVLRGHLAKLTPETVTSLPHRQDEFYRLHGGRFEILETGFEGRIAGTTL